MPSVSALPMTSSTPPSTIVRKHGLFTDLAEVEPASGRGSMRAKAAPLRSGRRARGSGTARADAAPTSSAAASATIFLRRRVGAADSIRKAR